MWVHFKIIPVTQNNSMGESHLATDRYKFSIAVQVHTAGEIITVFSLNILSHIL